MEDFSPMRTRPVRAPDGRVFGSVEALVQSLFFVDPTSFQHIEYDEVDMSLNLYKYLSDTGKLNGGAARIIAQTSTSKARDRRVCNRLSFYLYVSACIIQFCQHPKLCRRAQACLGKMRREALKTPFLSLSIAVYVAVKTIRFKGGAKAYSGARAAFSHMVDMIQQRSVDCPSYFMRHIDRVLDRLTTRSRMNAIETIKLNEEKSGDDDNGQLQDMHHH